MLDKITIEYINKHWTALDSGTYVPIYILQPRSNLASIAKNIFPDGATVQIKLTKKQKRRLKAELDQYIQSEEFQRQIK